MSFRYEEYFDKAEQAATKSGGDSFTGFEDDPEFIKWGWMWAVELDGGDEKVTLQKEVNEKAAYKRDGGGDLTRGEVIAIWMYG